MFASVACDALRSGKRLELRYDGFSRVVEVHTVGTNGKGHDCMRAWQVRGGSSSGERSGWKLFRLDEAVGAHALDENAEVPRPGYKRGDAAFAIIRCQL